ncbi:Clusterin-associated protein-1 [Phytophthora cactorum]|nr:Clusterin-associated protein-1 [Phytophthora cactorum]
MYYFVRQSDAFFADAHLFSFGGSQSNAMLALAQLANARRVPFTYFSRELQLKDEIVRGIWTWPGRWYPNKRFSVVLPCGTGTTALYLAQHLHPEIELYAVPCVGDAAYLQQQFQQLIDEDPSLHSHTALLPRVLVPKRKNRFGRLWWPLYDMYHEVLLETKVNFDLVYGAFAWHTLFSDAAVLDEVLDRNKTTVSIPWRSTKRDNNELASLKLRNLTEMMRSLGYPRPISMENFRKPNFELVSDLLYWMVKKYDPSSSVTEEIDTEDDRVEFLTQVATEVLAKARIRLNPKKLYAADGFAVKELIKLARVLYEASRIDLAAQQEPDDDDDEVSVKSLLGSRVKDRRPHASSHRTSHSLEPSSTTSWRRSLMSVTHDSKLSDSWMLSPPTTKTQVNRSSSSEVSKTFWSIYKKTSS